MKATDKAFQVELLISELLRWGVLVSLVLLALGTTLCFLQGTDYGVAGGSAADLHRLITQDHAFPRSLSWLGSGVVRLQGQAVVVLGLLLLIATPVVRVFVSIFAFLWERDYAYVVFTTLVFMLLVLSFVLGKVG